MDSAYETPVEISVSASSAQLVGSTRLSKPCEKPQPPSSFCALSKYDEHAGRTSGVASDAFGVAAVPWVGREEFMRWLRKALRADHMTCLVAGGSCCGGRATPGPGRL